MNLRLSKYNPIYRNDLGIYTKDEWTSISDIGRTFAGEVFTYDLYYDVENKYVETIIDFFKSNNINEIEISNIEDHSDRTKSDYFKDLTIMDFKKNKKVYLLNEISEIIRLGLREVIWCKLIGVNNNFTVQMDFGHDYYIHFSLQKGGIINNEIIRKNGLFLEDY